MFNKKEKEPMRKETPIEKSEIKAFLGPGSQFEGKLLFNEIVRLDGAFRGEVTSHDTLIVGEKRMNLATLGQPQDDDNEGYTAGWNEDTIRSTDLPPATDYLADIGDGEKLFGSSHPGTVNMVFVDGSVHALAYFIDAETFANLGNRKDGQSINLDL